ncbi:hypothetical protein EVAR_95377_1 [Eumeta japonica]|uniref:Uncharacterized protein n=1 Tax=Eumeta variegata TaxID=151549 RepID=A0A4C2A312_EUMVA|nr:hypothetical protein EVAR_95377_1 [Eumeta japonica]
MSLERILILEGFLNVFFSAFRALVDALVDGCVTKRLRPRTDISVSCSGGSLEAELARRRTRRLTTHSAGARSGRVVVQRVALILRRRSGRRLRPGSRVFYPPRWRIFGIFHFGIGCLA